MFDKIVESVLNEISAEDAYAKFYNSIDKETYFTIVDANKGKFDKLVRFVMDFVKSGKFRPEQAYVLLSQYNSADNDARITVKSKFEKGEYDSPMDIIRDLQYFKSHGVVTNKSVQTIGYGVLYEDDKERLTYTTTYEANHHYFGNTQWCTASDRMGRYDGWYYFLFYTLGYDDIDDIKRTYLNGGLDGEEVHSVLMQYLRKDDNELFQIQVFRHADGRGTGQICDSKDHSTNFAKLYMSEEVKNIMYSKVDEIADLEQENLKKESNYQLSREDMLARKKAIRNQKLLEQINNIFLPKKELVQKTSEKMFSSNLLSNEQFLQQMIDNFEMFHSNNVSDDEKENELKKQGYLNITETVAFENGTSAVLVKPCYGKLQNYDLNYNLQDNFFEDLDYFIKEYEGMDDEDDLDSERYMESRLGNEFKSAIVILKSEGTKPRLINADEILNVIKFDTANVSIQGCFNSGMHSGEQVVTTTAHFDTIPNMFAYYVNNRLSLYSTTKNKSVCVTDMNERMIWGNALHSRYFWVNGKIVAAFSEHENKIGFLLDENFSVATEYDWCVLMRQNTATGVCILCDKKTKEIYIAGVYNFIDTGEKLGNKVKTIQYRGHTIYITYEGNTLKAYSSF